MAEVNPPGPGELAVDMREENGKAVVRLCGDLDMTNVKYARVAIEAALSSHPGRVVLDASGLTYMDSSGIALLVLVTRDGPELQVRNPTPIVRQLIELTGLGQTLPITDENKP